MTDPRKDLANHTLISKYARYLPERRRRETYDEAVQRMFSMHRRHLTSRGTFDAQTQIDLDRAERAVLEQRVLGSQRALQFGGDAIHRINVRGYNCSYSFFDRPRFLAEAVWVLLAGCGVGFSVQKHHVAKLPVLRKPNIYRKAHIVEDSIEGWADAFDALFRSYVGGLSVRFDYSQVRPAGSAISTSSAKAPGPKPLRDSLEAMRGVLDAVVARGGVIRPIDAYDMVMHAASCVRAGGIRRSATIALFSPDDEEMTNAKTGDWFKTNPQRRLSNNSALLVRSMATREQFDRLIKATEQFGEPGFFFSDSTELGTNPCQPAFATVLTPDGIRTFADIDVGSLIWSESGWTRVVRKWSTGHKEVKAYRTTSGVFVGTENHRVVQRGSKVEVGQAEAIDCLKGPPLTRYNLMEDVQAVIDGLMCGDGYWHKASRAPFLCVGRRDADAYRHWFAERGLDLEFVNDRTAKVETTLGQNDLPKLPERRVPAKYRFGGPATVASFLRGLYAANGSVVDNRITLKTSSPTMRDDVQVMLSSLGIASYFTTNRAHDVEFHNGTYECKESYDINVSTDRGLFMDLIGFIHDYKAKKVRTPTAPGRVQSTFPVRSAESLGVHEVFDITVDNASHTYWTGGVNVSNCGEITLDPVDHETGETAWSFCNLSTVNVAACPTPADFYDACIQAATIGTVQATYTDVGYLTPATKRVLERDALLGVSLTGMADNPTIAFDPVVLRCGAWEVVETNRILAARLGIRPAARCTTVKPEGTGSLLLGVGNGIHPHHARQYLRYVEGGRKDDPLVQFIASINPEAVVPSAYAEDEVKLVFPIDLGAGPRWLKAGTDPIDHLEKVRMVQAQWVAPGGAVGCHNVSNTVQVPPGRWQDVADHIWAHRADYAGVSLLGSFGDLDYEQAPFVAVRTPHEAFDEYGPLSDRFDKALDVYEKWIRLTKTWKPIDFTTFREDEDRAAGVEVVACAGGACSF